MKSYVSIDIETTGLDPARCQILEIGAVIDDWVTPVEQLSRWQCYVMHEQIVGEPTGLAMNADVLRTIGERTKPGNYYFPDEVGRYFHQWLRDKGININSVVAAGKNFASFDRQFLQRLPNFDDRVHFHHRSIDPAMLFWEPEVDDVPPGTKQCMERAGLRGEVAHSAVEDALVVVKLVRVGANYRRAMVAKPSAREVAKQLSDQFMANGQYNR